MESGAVKKKWGFQVKQEHITATATLTVRSALTIIKQNLKENDPRPIIPLGHGDPSAFPCFRTTPVAADAVVDAVRSAEFDCYSPSVGILPARRAIADYLNSELPCKLSPDDVYLTAGCKQAIQVILTVLARPGANILLPKPGFPLYEANARHTRLEIRHFDLLPEKGWEVDLDGLEALADENTVAMVIVNPGNPCGNVFTYQQLQKIAEKARKLGIMVISDEVYDHLTFGSTPYVRMGVFGSTVPVITLGSMSKRWIVPGWRLGWLVTSDPSGILQELRIVDSIKGYLNISSGPATFVQVKLNLSLLEGISDDMEFALQLAKEESVIVLPGMAVGMKNWLRITFAIEPSALEEGLGRIKAFCQRHAKQQ
ncbi:Aminotran 1 2 domain-containing protein [Citrus sinensis]|nr:Aminotran 1 2 domain-containing protein [Citrus sinensis]